MCSVLILEVSDQCLYTGCDFFPLYTPVVCLCAFVVHVQYACLCKLCVLKIKSANFLYTVSFTKATHARWGKTVSDDTLTH